MNSFDFVFLELRLIIIIVVFWFAVRLVAVHYSIDAQTCQSFDLLLLSFSEVVCFASIFSFFLNSISIPLSLRLSFLIASISIPVPISYLHHLSLSISIFISISISTPLFLAACQYLSFSYLIYRFSAHLS